MSFLTLFPPLEKLEWRVGIKNTHLQKEKKKKEEEEENKQTKNLSSESPECVCGGVSRGRRLQKVTEPVGSANEDIGEYLAADRIPPVMRDK